MKFLQFFPLFLLIAVSCARAQTTPAPLPLPDADASASAGAGADADAGSDALAPGTTDIHSQELQMDEVTHIAVFTGNVVTSGTNFKMTCHEMTVNFDKGGKIDTIVAKGDVVIVQPGRITHCGQAVYHKDEDMFDLTDRPTINDNGKTIAAPEIIIHRTSQSLQTRGPSRLIIPEGSGALSNKPAAGPAKQP
jgi:lipopolysaccharide transport protein LptA